MKRLISLLAITMMMGLSGLALTAGPGARATPGTNGPDRVLGGQGEGIELFTIKRGRHSACSAHGSRGRRCGRRVVFRR